MTLLDLLLILSPILVVLVMTMRSWPIQEKSFSPGWALLLVLSVLANLVHELLTGPSLTGVVFLLVALAASLFCLKKCRVLQQIDERIAVLQVETEELRWREQRYGD